MSDPDYILTINAEDLHRVLDLLFEGDEKGIGVGLNDQAFEQGFVYDNH